MNDWIRQAIAFCVFSLLCGALVFTCIVTGIHISDWQALVLLCCIYGSYICGTLGKLDFQRSDNE